MTRLLRWCWARAALLLLLAWSAICIAWFVGYVTSEDAVPVLGVILIGLVWMVVAGAIGIVHSIVRRVR
jgi:hypothetical protein